MRISSKTKCLNCRQERKDTLNANPWGRSPSSSLRHIPIHFPGRGIPSLPVHRMGSQTLVLLAVLGTVALAVQASATHGAKGANGAPGSATALPSLRIKSGCPSTMTKYLNGRVGALHRIRVYCKEFLAVPGFKGGCHRSCAHAVHDMAVVLQVKKPIAECVDANPHVMQALSRFTGSLCCKST